MENIQRRFVLNFLAYAALRDAPVIQLSQLAGIDLSALQEQQDYAISNQQLSHLWKEAAALTSDNLFGLHFGESLQLSALGIVGEIIRSSETVGEAVTQAAALAHLMTGLFRLHVSDDKSRFTVSFHPLTDHPERFEFRQTLELFMVFVVHEIDGLLLKKIRPLAVQLPYRIDNAVEYARVFRCEVEKSTDTYALVFDAHYWNEPLLTANYEIQRTLLQRVTQQGNVHGNSLKDRIHQYLLTNAYLGIRSLGEIALNFNISPRTLQRKLKEEGISYQDVADDVRKSLALHYLEDGAYPVKTISYMLGYNEISAFTRAFKRWTGKTPVNYQKN
ncbi:AraC family transcriptional regulator [Chitinophaga rhizophila]|uniref:AraC family transcriptional regulator n=1 Tax=Chitinophaga rhizophila TaxID=2866212 RepID=A0ABS7GFJ5_9BACT|nr:AraC family transcriptional regulator [Chitinophaga rhizophila]MBW8686463.1 AraC family transcriptional regulator [Chitinophaga rhizophila]